MRRDLKFAIATKLTFSKPKPSLWKWEHIPSFDMDTT